MTISTRICNAVDYVRSAYVSPLIATFAIVLHDGNANDALG
jgi:hypothetical protein